MIALHTDCLLFQLTNGESIPCSPDTISVEIVGEASDLIDPEMLRHAATSVFHYFKIELAREIVTVGEFSLALENVLRHLGYTIQSGNETVPPTEKTDGTDLQRLATEFADNLELFFFPRLRDELRAQLRVSRLLHFRGLRGCVKQLTGARRWSNRCDKTRDQIVEYLRGCLTAEREKNRCALVVE
jgi:hypothetical protein